MDNQIAMGDATVVPATLNRLMREGLNRHDAIHAIASIHMGIIFDVVTEKDDGGDFNTKYGRELAELTAKSSELLDRSPRAPIDNRLAARVRPVARARKAKDGGSRGVSLGQRNA
jgi:hypothetical protein